MIRNLSAFLLVLGFSLVFSYYYPHISLAPGSVQEYHKKYENDCLNCHKPFSGVSNNSCLKCHEVIGDSKIYKSKKSAHAEVRVNDMHRALGETSCFKCHPEHLAAERNQELKFFHDLKKLKGTCNSCHIKPGDPVHLNRSDCSSCHSVKTWKGAKFFHSNDIKNCSSCHKTPVDSFHRSLSSDCVNCHNTQNWRAADFDHTRFFSLSGPHRADCKTCHPGGNFASYTCYGCHEHSERGVLRKHRRMGVPIDKCTDCHRDSSERKAKNKLREIWGNTDSTTTATPRRSGKYRDDDDDEEHEHRSRRYREHDDDD